MIIGVDKFSIQSALTSPYLGKKLLTNVLNLSFSWRCDSFAIVSNTIDDFPEPDTPVNMVIFLFGIFKEILFKLFSLQPFKIINSLFIFYLLHYFSLNYLEKIVIIVVSYT